MDEQCVVPIQPADERPTEAPNERAAVPPFLMESAWQERPDVSSRSGEPRVSPLGPPPAPPAPPSRGSAGKVLLAVIAIGAITVAQLVGVILVMLAGLSDSSLWTTIVPEVFGAVAAVVAVALLGGSSLLPLKRDDFAFTFKFGWWCMAISVGLFVLELSTNIFEGNKTDPQWIMRGIQITIFCLAVGVFEECLFRGIVFQTTLSIMGDTHKGVGRAIMLTSLIFGLAHVDFSLSYSDALSVLQAVLKVIQTGMYSVLLCVIVLRTRRLGGVSLFHALDDLFIIFPGVALFSDELEVDYVMQGDDALPSVLFYLFVIALYMPFVIKSLRELRRGRDVTLGAFVEKRIPAPTPVLGAYPVPTAQPMPLAYEVPAAQPPAQTVPSAYPMPAEQPYARTVPRQTQAPVPVTTPVPYPVATPPTKQSFEAPRYAPPNYPASPAAPVPYDTRPHDGRPPAPLGF